MKQKMAKKLACIAFAGMMLPMAAQAADADLQLKVDKLTQEVNDLKGSVQRVQDKSLSKWLSIGGSYRFRMDNLHGETAGYTDAMATFANAQNTMQSGFFNSSNVYYYDALGNPVLATSLTTPSASSVWQGYIGQMMTFSDNMNKVKTVSQAGQFLTDNANMLGAIKNYAVEVPASKPKNETLYTSKFDLDLHAKATQDVTVNVKLDMYKTFGSQDDNATTGSYFSDRVGAFDGTLGHVPSTGLLNVDRAYATWSNIAEQPVWFSVGRRPSSNGAPTNLKLNNERPGNGGTPALLVDYAFDGMTIGWAPDIEPLPGAYAKVCYGRGFDSGFKTSTNTVKDTDMLGVALIPVDTDPLRVWLQWNRGFNIFDFPVMSDSTFGNTAPSTNLGSIDWYGAGAMTTLKDIGPGKLNFFADFGMSITHPNDNVSAQAGFMGLGTGAFFAPEAPSDKTGYAAYAGVRYDLPSKTKLGFEYNHGSKDWITFAPASDDMWTSKVGTRGNVYEGYVIQELDLKPISSYFSKTFFKVGYQYYDFQYTGSNNWVGAPVKISSIQSTDMLLLAPVKTAQDIYATFEVKF
ncbi:MAG: DUF3373 domain-containing protein [Desulfuromonadaceae bacterium]|nr:DUF3373 domain-containing protein [Desulfuromonadaceae bacterium]MDD2848730.1 DUF3373 domain-containing protein [Desulfuromonadaceae bacterium]MDD4130380.1 DUF3373 domain-containing protein [Desulfuromonadaceae bacterium]